MTLKARLRSRGAAEGRPRSCALFCYTHGQVMRDELTSSNVRAARWRGSVVDALSMIKERWFLRAAFGLAACLVLFGEGASISDRVSVDTFAIMTGADPLTGGITIMAAFLLAAVFAALVQRCIETTAFLAVDALVNVVGCVLLFSEVLNLGLGAFAARIGGLVVGFGAALLLVRWADLLIPRGAKASSLCLAAAMLFVVAFDLLSKVLVDVGLVGAVLLLCAVSPALLVLAAREAQVERAERTIEEYRGVVPVWLSFATIALYAVVMGGIQVGGSGSVEQAAGVVVNAASSSLAVDAGMVVASLVIVLGARFLRGNNMGFYRSTILALLSVSLYLSAVLSSAWSSMNIGLMTVSRVLIFAYVWTMFSTPAKTMSPVRLFSVGWLLFLVPNNLSTRLGQAVVGTDMPLLAYDLMLAVILLALFVFEFTPILTGRSVEDACAGDSSDAGEDAFAARIAQLVERGGLTPREQDVLVALARGRSAQHIADTFVVSKETARTHIRHVYQKLDVHSREELMDLVEEGMPAA